MPSELKGLQKIELAMFQRFIEICQKHRIRYFLLGGSALGAIRHSGFIPWDDDIDIGIPRPDYERFLSVAQEELGSDLFLQTWRTDPEYPLLFAKIRNNNTTFIQSDVAHLKINHGIFIDIFPLDGFSSNPWVKYFNWVRFKLCKIAIRHKLGIREKNAFFEGLIAIYAAFFSVSKLREKAERIMSKYPYDSSDLVANWCGAWGLKEVHPQPMLGQGRCVAFEEQPASIPEDADGYLKQLYGAYMVLPPEEKRVSHHHTDIIDLELAYTQHIGQS